MWIVWPIPVSWLNLLCLHSQPDRQKGYCVRPSLEESWGSKKTTSDDFWNIVVVRNLWTFILSFLLSIRNYFAYRNSLLSYGQSIVRGRPTTSSAKDHPKLLYYFFIFFIRLWRWWWWNETCTRYRRWCCCVGKLCDQSYKHLDGCYLTLKTMGIYMV